MTSRRSPLSYGFPLCLCLSVVSALVGHAHAQCATQWPPGHGIPGTDGVVSATTVWDRDGSGPMQPVLVLGGHFTIAGTVLSNNIATYDPVSREWSTLGSGMDGDVLALKVLPNGDLVAGGLFSHAGGVIANCIARWNGTIWSPLGAGMGGRVNALTTLPNGELVAGGDFTIAGGVFANRIARWNGTNWSPLGAGMGDRVNALTTLPNGELVAGGNFTIAGGMFANRIARWNGTSWSPLGAGTNSNVHTLTTLPSGDVVAGGQFTIAGGVGANYIARWDGTNWLPLGAGMSGSFNPVVSCLAVLAGGDLVAGGFFSAGSTSAYNIARWDGTSWSALAGGIVTGGLFSDRVQALTTLPNGDLVAGGDIIVAGGQAVTNIARWDGTSWSQLGSGINNAVLALTSMPNGDLVAGGYFTTAGVRRVDHIVRWNGTHWSALGSGMNSNVHALLTLPNGDLVAGGRFTTAGGVSAFHIARWNGTSWSPIPGLQSGYPGYDGVFALTLLPNGDLVAGGNFTVFGITGANNIARWDGTSWWAMGSWATPAINNGVFALTTLPNGDLVAAGQFTTAGGVSVNNIARWDGTNWSPLGAGVIGFAGTVPTVSCLMTLSNGDVVAGGYFSMAGGLPANCIARWNGTSWSALGSGMSIGVVLPGYGTGYSNGVWALATLPDEDIVAAGYFATAGGVAVNSIARWDGTSWLPLGAGMSPVPGHPGAHGVPALTKAPNGDLVAGGSFEVVDGAVSAYMARLTTTCPATAVSTGAGCTGSGGPNVLTVTALPWTGSTFRSVATGMPNNALAIGVRGLSTASIPLASILPQGVAGCTLYVNPDTLDLHVPTIGSVQTQFAIPNTVVLGGQVFHQQIVPVELDPLGNIIALTSTNRLTLTIGTF